MNKAEQYFKQEANSIINTSYKNIYSFLETYDKFRKKSKEFVREDILEVFDSCAFVKMGLMKICYGGAN